MDAIYRIKYRKDMPNSKSVKIEVNNREDRLKAALKANMAKRKAQIKARTVASANKANRKD